MDRVICGHHKWTEEERDIVRRDYMGTNDSAKSISTNLHVSFNAVKGQVQKLGICTKDKRPWTRDEITKLTDMARSVHPKVIATKLGRTETAVRLKAKRLRLFKRYRDGWFTKAEVAEILGVDHKKVQSWADNGWLVMKSYNPDCHPQKGGGAFWQIKDKALRDFLRSHPSELQGRNVDMVMVVEILAGITSQAG